MAFLWCLCWSRKLSQISPLISNLTKKVTIQGLEMEKQFCYAVPVKWHIQHVTACNIFNLPAPFTINSCQKCIFTSNYENKVLVAS